MTPDATPARKSLLAEMLEDRENLRLFLQARAIYDVTDQIEELLTEQGVSRADLARRLGKSEKWVAELLDGEGNKTIRTVADVFAVLNREWQSSHRDIQISNAGDLAEVRAAVGGCDRASVLEEAAGIAETLRVEEQVGTGVWNRPADGREIADAIRAAK
jgi:transcriptional regulator with XRE-family HTH domain